MEKSPSLPRLLGGVFFLIWAVIFFTWAPMESIRVITGIACVFLGGGFVTEYVIKRHRSKRTGIASPRN